jgi:sugar phosphate permease
VRRPRFFYGWTVVALLWLANFGSHGAVSFTFGLFVLPMSQDLGVSRGAIGWLQTARLAGSGLSSISLGRLIDRYGARVLVPATGLLSALIVVAISQAPRMWMLYVLFALLGVAGLSAPGNALTAVPVAKWFVRRRGKAIAVTTFGGAVGGAVFSLVHQGFIDTWGWRGAFAVSAGLLVLLTVPLQFALLRRTPEDLGLRPDGDASPAPTPAAVAAPAPVDEASWTVREALRSRVLWQLAAAYLVSSFATGGFVVHRPAFWQELGYPTGLIAGALALDSAVYAFAALGAGALLDRAVPRLVAAGAMTTHALAMLAALTWANTGSVFVVAALIGSGAGTAAVARSVLLPAYYGRAHLGAIWGVLLPANLLGLGLGAPVVGMLYDAAGGSYRPGIWLLFGLMLAYVAMMLTAGPPKRYPPA